MKFILNFAKGSLFAAVLLGVVYSPFTAEAESQKTFAQKGVVTTAAVISPHISIEESELFNVDRPTRTPTPTPEKKIIAALIVTPKTTKVPVPSPTKTVQEVNGIATPTPVFKQPAPEEGIPYDEHFTKYAAAFNVNKELLVRIARCESGFRTGAVNGPYLGMFQYLDSTWQSTRKTMGENPDPALRANAEEAIKTSAWKIAHGGISAWPVCGS